MNLKIDDQQKKLTMPGVLSVSVPADYPDKPGHLNAGLKMNAYSNHDAWYECNNKQQVIDITNIDKKNNDAVSVGHSYKTELLSAQQLRDYAKQMEQNRAQLAGLLIESKEGLAVLIFEFRQQITLGIDLSERIKRNQKQAVNPVQKNNIEQDTAKVFESRLLDCLDSLISDDSAKGRVKALNFIKQVHFLPSFLLQVCTELSKKPDLINADLFARVMLLEQKILAARDAIIHGNLRLVRFVAKQYNSDPVIIADLIQDGTIGLIKAVDRYEWQRELRFSTYAVFWIRQTISRALLQQKKIVRLPYNIAEKASLVFQAINKSLVEHNNRPSIAELAEICEMSKDEVKAIIENKQANVSLTCNIAEDEAMYAYENTLEQEHYPQPIISVTHTSLQTTLQKAVNTLTERESTIIYSRFGLIGQHEMSLQDLSNQFGVSCERIRQIQKKALLKLKNNFNSDLYDFLESG